MGRPPQLYSISTGPENVDRQFTRAAAAIGPVKWGTMPTAWVSQMAATFIISVMPPTFGSVERMKSTSWFSTSLLKSHLSPPFFAVGQRHRRHLPELWNVLQRVLVGDRVFDEERLIGFDGLAGTQRVVQVEALVKGDAPVAVRPHALAHVLAILFHPAHHRARVVDAADRHVTRRHAEGAIPGFHRGFGALFARRLRFPSVRFQPLGHLSDEDRQFCRRTDAYLMVLAGGDAGLRLGEIISLEWRDIDLAARRLTVECSDWQGHVTVPKGGRSRQLPMTQRLTAALERSSASARRARVVPTGRVADHS